MLPGVTIGPAQRRNCLFRLRYDGLLIPTKYGRQRPEEVVAVLARPSNTGEHTRQRLRSTHIRSVWQTRTAARSPPALRRRERSHARTLYRTPTENARRASALRRASRVGQAVALASFTHRRAQMLRHRRLQFNQDGLLGVRLSRAIGTPGNFRVAFHTGEDLHFVGMVAGLGGTTEQVHLSAAGWARGPIFDAKRTRLPHANWVFG
jgi:hypothetical protein